MKSTYETMCGKYQQIGGYLLPKGKSTQGSIWEYLDVKNPVACSLK